MNKKTKTSVLLSLPIFGILFITPIAIAAEVPAEWLDRMSAAVQKTSYEGTVIRSKGGDAEALKVVRRFSDGIISEKLTVQEGNGLEIIRNGDEVHCILPDQKSVLVESWNNQSTLFSNLPSSDVRFGHEYDLSLVREERVAGRKAVLLAIRPHDEFRFGASLVAGSRDRFSAKKLNYLMATAACSSRSSLRTSTLSQIFRRALLHRRSVSRISLFKPAMRNAWKSMSRRIGCAMIFPRDFMSFQRRTRNCRARIYR